jgi:hypothetical protein
MKHIKPIESILNESREERQLHVLYLISQTPIEGRRDLPYNRMSNKELTPTYYMIQDAVAQMGPEDRLYRISVSAALCTQNEYIEWLESKGYPVHRYMAVMQRGDVLPSDMRSEDLSELRWNYDGIEIDDRVLTWDLRSIMPSGDIVYEVQPSEIERVRAKLR